MFFGVGIKHIISRSWTKPTLQWIAFKRLLWKFGKWIENYSNGIDRDNITYKDLKAPHHIHTPYMYIEVL